MSGIAYILEELEDARVFEAIDWGTDLEGDDIEKLQQAFPSTDFTALVKEWEQEAGKELIDWGNPTSTANQDETETENI